MSEENALTEIENSEDENKEKVSLIIGLPFFFIVIVGFIALCFYLETWLQDENRLPVQEIVFNGDLKRLDESILSQLIKDNAQESFFSLDVNDVHRTVESHPWVFRASIRKRWPSKLYIYIIEQQAVAEWNDDLLLNRYGDTFDGDGHELDLPSLFGPGGSEKTVLTAYSHMQKLLNHLDIKISQVILSERFAWHIELNNEITLKLGRKEYIDRLQRFIDVYPLLMQQQQEVDYVDLRYDTGLAVGYQSQTQTY